MTVQVNKTQQQVLNTLLDKTLKSKTYLKSGNTKIQNLQSETKIGSLQAKCNNRSPNK